MSSEKPGPVEFDLSRHKLSKKGKLILQLAVCFIPAAIILSVIHETGHAVVALALKFQIQEIHLSFLPFVFDFSNPFVRMIPPPTATQLDLVMVMLAGSGATLFWGLVLFLLYYKRKLPQLAEVFCLTYSVLLIMDLGIYSIADIFFLRIGDFFYLYTVSPILCGVIVVGVIILFIAFVYHKDVILDRFDIDV
jgi:hypothetical protein